MNNCTDGSIQELLPDLLHRTLPADVRERVETHLVSCEECTQALEVLRTVMSAAVFAPTIDVDRVVQQIPPYQPIAPTAGFPSRTRLVSWLVAATLAVTIVGGGSVLVMRENSSTGTSAVATVPPLGVRVPAQTTPVGPETSLPAISPENVAATSRPHAHTLAFAADVEGLSDGNLVQLMNEMNQFDALPTTEIDPVISVDSADDLNAELR